MATDPRAEMARINEASARIRAEQEDAETCVVVQIETLAGTVDEVLVRLPGHVDRSDVHVDFRYQRGVWTPAELLGCQVEVRHQ